MVYSAALKGLLRMCLGRAPEPSACRPGAPLVLVADGVGGFDLCGAGLRYAAVAAGVDLDVRILTWGHGWGRWHSDLTDVANHRTQAEALVGLVREARADRPERPVFLLGKSGGSGVVVRALEDLPADSVEAAVLIAPALSPEYDLSRALRAVRRELVVFWSPLDLIVLGLGTRLFGTVDRVHSAAAGLTSFRRPAGVAEPSYAKLRQVRWIPKMASTGYLGGHVGPDLPAFLKGYVIPLFSQAGSDADRAEIPGPLQAAPAAGR